MLFDWIIKGQVKPEAHMFAVSFLKIHRQGKCKAVKSLYHSQQGKWKAVKILYHSQEGKWKAVKSLYHRQEKTHLVFT